MSWISAVRADRVVHFAAGMLVAGLVGLIPCAKWFAFAGGALAGLAKEIYDQIKSKSFDRVDLGATVLGAAVTQGLICGYMFIW